MICSDISTALQNEIDAINSTNKLKLNRFQHVDSETSNLVFIKTTLADPVELGSYISNERYYILSSIFK